MDVEPLEGIGLTRNESIVYTTLLSLGKAHIGQLAEKTRMHRRTIYDCLERLEDRGLVGFVMEGKTRTFTAVHPEKIRDILKEKEERIEDIMPKLLEMANSAKAPTEVTIHKGREGLKYILEDIVKADTKTWYSFTSAGRVRKVFPHYISGYHRRRTKEGITLKVIFGRNQEAMQRARELKKIRMTEIRLIDSKYIVPISTWIYGNKVAFIIWESHTGILLENKETADTYRNYFKVLWKISKEF